MTERTAISSDEVNEGEGCDVKKNVFDNPEAKVFFMAKDIQEKDVLIKELVAALEPVAFDPNILNKDELKSIDEVLKKAKDMGYR